MIASTQMNIPSNRFIRLVSILSLAVIWTFQVGSAQAQDPADVYLEGYLRVQDAERYVVQKNYEKAYLKYADARKIFTDLAQRFPTFEVSMVDFRRKKINEAISKLEQVSGRSGITKAYPPRTRPSSLPTGGSSAGRPPSGNESALKGLLRDKDEQIRLLEKDRTAQARKLAQNDRELRDARQAQQVATQKISSLQKQFAQAQAELTKAHNAESGDVAKWKDEVARLQNEVAIADKSAADSGKRAENLQQELDKASNYEMSRKADRSELEAERDRLKKLLAGSASEQIQILVKENDRLKKSLDEARKEVGQLREEKSTDKALIAKLRTKITTVEVELAKLQSENADYRKQVADLTQKLKSTDAQLDAMAKTKGGANPILVKENHVLREIIGKQLKSQARRKQAKQRVVAELAKLEIGSKEVLDMLDSMGDNAPLSQEEIDVFKGSLGNFIIDKPDANAAPLEYPNVDNNEGPKTGIGLNEDLTQFAKAAAYDFLQGSFNRSELSYETILKIVPDNIHSLRNLGIVKIRLKKWDEAKLALEKALAYGPEDHYSHYVLGVLHYRHKQPEAAIQAMESSLQLNPNNARAHFYIAVICMEQSGQGEGRRNPDRAVSELKQVIKLDPKYGDAHFNLAILYIESPQPQILQAREHYRQALRLGSPADPTMDRQLGGI